MKINMNKHIWEGWTVKDFINELQPQLDMIQNGQSWKKPFTSRTEMAKWIKDNQPYYKRNIKEVNVYFYTRYRI